MNWGKQNIQITTTEWNNIIKELEKSRNSYMLGDETGALRQLRVVEGLLKSLKEKIALRNSDAIFITTTKKLPEPQKNDAIFL